MAVKNERYNNRNMKKINPLDCLGMPKACTYVRGSSQYPDICGKVTFYAAGKGTMVMAEVSGLPFSGDKCVSDIFGFHVHEGSSCTGNAQDPFADTKTHYNPHNCEHPAHTGDLPPLFGNEGYAFLVCYTERFKPQEVVGRTVVIHRKPDDFVTQPSGNSGDKIACGEIYQIQYS